MFNDELCRAKWSFLMWDSHNIWERNMLHWLHWVASSYSLQPLAARPLHFCNFVLFRPVHYFFLCIAATTLIDPNLTNHIFHTTLSILTFVLSSSCLPTGPPNLSARPWVSFTHLWFWSYVAVCRRALRGSILERAKTAWNNEGKYVCLIIQCQYFLVWPLHYRYKYRYLIACKVILLVRSTPGQLLRTK